MNRPDVASGRVLPDNTKIETGEIPLFVRRNNSQDSVTISVLTNPVGNNFALYIPGYVPPLAATTIKVSGWLTYGEGAPKRMDIPEREVESNFTQSAPGRIETLS